MSDSASPDDLRKDGWAVAVHNDYRLNGRSHTFWLFTRGNRFIKGEGETDAAALDEARFAAKTQKTRIDELKEENNALQARLEAVEQELAEETATRKTLGETLAVSHQTNLDLKARIAELEKPIDDAELQSELERLKANPFNATLYTFALRLSRQSKSNALPDPFSSGLPMHIEAQAICLWLKQREHREEEAGKRAADFIQRQERDRLAVGKLADETADALAKSNALLGKYYAEKD
jgi:chromosome segregation ATPase